MVCPRANTAGVTISVITGSFTEKKRFVQAETVTKFVPLNLGQFSGTRAAESACPLRLVFSGGFTIEINPGFDPRLLQQLIIALRGVK